jgi:hypothetical protein
MDALYGHCVSRGEPCSAERCCMRPTIPVPGRLGATFLSSSITILLFGMMVSCQDGILKPMLALLPMPALGGIICLGYLIWFFSWIVLYYILSGRESVGTLPVWTAVVLGATLLSILIAEVSFAWRALEY